MDDDTLTTDTLSPEANNSSHGSDSQVSAHSSFLYQCYPAFPRTPLLICCMCVGASFTAGGAAAQRGAEKPRPNHRTTHPAAGLCLCPISAN